MNKQLMNICLLAACVAQAEANAGMPLRTEVCLNGTWQLKVEGFDKPTDVRVPGSYAGQDQLWGKDHWDVWGYPKDWYNKAAVYHRTFDLPKAPAGQRVLIHFGGVRHVVRVGVNGQEAGSWSDSYIPFAFDITDWVRAGENNLQVHIATNKTCGLFEDYNEKRRGIYQDVFLKFVPEVRVTPDIFIRTSVSRSTLACDVPVRNDSAAPQTVSLRFKVLDAEGRVVQQWADQEQVTLAPGEEKTLKTSNVWKHPHLWSIDDPYLHHLETEVVSGNKTVLDRHRLRFGFREITWKKQHLYLNGRELFLRGHGGHESGDLQHSKEYAESWIRQLKAQGLDLMRLHDYPRDEALYDAADEMGFLFLSEAAHHFRLPPKELQLAHTERMVKRLRNRPSVLMWSVANELHWRKFEEPVQLIELCRELDPTRPAYNSDFSGFSLHGDVLSKHYDAPNVWSDWEKYGPDKPMVWDEIGSVWQHDRPLKTGPAGFEISSQDVATGIWRDGWEHLRRDIEVFADGKEINGEFYRVNAYVPWEFSYVMYRFQPFNNFQRFYPKYDWIEGDPGMKPLFINPCSVTHNIWDPTLPEFQPNPGLYCFNEFLARVRFPDDAKERTFFSGQKVERSGRLFYEDHRPADRVEFRVETPDGKVLSSVERTISLAAGEYRPEFKSEWNLPTADTITPVRLVRQFSSNGKTGYRKSTEAKIFPAFQAVDLTSHKIAVIGESLQSLFGGAGVPLAQARIMIAESFDPSWEKQVSEGARVLVQPIAGQGADKQLSFNNGIALKGGWGPSVTIQPGCVQHKLLDGLGQEDFSFWRGGSSSRSFPLLEGRNVRRILFGSKDGSGSAMQEMFIGRGVVLESALNMSSLQEPAAGFLINRMVNYLNQYQPAETVTGLFVPGEGRFADWLKTLGAEVQSDLSASTVAAVDAQNAPALAAAKNDLIAHLEKGGTVWFSEVTPATIGLVREICGKPLRLTEPYFGQRFSCIKAPVSWARIGSPHAWVDYYDGILVPFPFEPNFNPLLAGVANLDLNWKGTPMFRQGVEVEGMNPVSASVDVQILMSNWHIGSETPAHLYGENLNGVRDLRQNSWFVNRDPVVLELTARGGRVLISQLDVQAGGAKVKRVMQTMLTNLGVSFAGAVPAPAEAVYDSKSRKDQLARFAVYDTQIDPVRRQFYGVPNPMPDYLKATRIGVAAEPEALPLLGFFGDPLTLGLSKPLAQALVAVVQMDKPVVLTQSARAADELRKKIGDKKYARVVFSLGESDLDAPLSVQEFRRNLEEVWKVLSEHSQKIYWVPIPSAFRADLQRAPKARELNQVAAELFEGKDVYMLPFVYEDHTELPIGYFSGNTTQFMPAEAKRLAERVAEAVISFGAQ